MSPHDVSFRRRGRSRLLAAAPAACGRHRRTGPIVFLLVIFLSCASAPRPALRTSLQPSGAIASETLTPVFTLTAKDAIDHPIDLTVDRSGRLLVLDAAGPDLVVFDRDGRLVDTWSVSGAGDRAFFRPTAVAVSGLAVLLLDPAERVVLRFDMRGQFQGTALDLDAQASVGEIGFFEPVDLEADHTGRLFISDREGHRVLAFDAAARFQFAFGSFGSGRGQLRQPEALAIDEAGRLFVLERGNRRVQEFDGSGSPLGIIPLPPAEDDGERVPVAAAITAGGDLLVVDDGGRVVGRSPFGRILFTHELPGTERIAVDPGGRIFLLVRDPARIEALDVEAR